MKRQTVHRIRERMNYLRTHRDVLVIDADVHLTDLTNMNKEQQNRYHRSTYYYHGRPIGIRELLSDMEMSRVDMCLIWQNPATTSYGSDKTENYNLLLQANRDIHEAALKYPQAFIPAGWTDPVALEMEGAQELIRICIREFGFPIIKMNPSQNAFPIDADEVIVLVRLITELGAVPAFHFGADSPYTPLSGLLKIAESIPESPILVVHMGGGGAGYLEAENLYRETREAGLKNPNLRFVLSSKRDTHMESDFIAFARAGEPFSSNLMCGSDAPYGNMAWNFGGFRAMFSNFLDERYTNADRHIGAELFSRELMNQFLGGNMANMAIEAYESILLKNPVAQ